MENGRIAPTCRLGERPQDQPAGQGKTIDSCGKSPTAGVRGAGSGGRLASRPSTEWQSGPMKVIAAVPGFGPCGCATLSRPVADRLLLHLDSYDQESGKYVLALHNDSLRSAIFLHYLVACSAHSTCEPVGDPTSPPNESMMLHDRRLEPKSNVQITDTCSSNEACWKLAPMRVFMRVGLLRDGSVISIFLYGRTGH